jgi:hypothetical protein
MKLCGMVEKVKTQEIGTVFSVDRSFACNKKDHFSSP